MEQVKIRRFEMGASGLGFDRLLESLGYSIGEIGSFYTISKSGQKAKRISRAEMIKMIDDERLRRGLEPIVKQNESL